MRGRNLCNCRSPARSAREIVILRKLLALSWDRLILEDNIRGESATKLRSMREEILVVTYAREKLFRARFLKYIATRNNFRRLKHIRVKLQRAPRIIEISSHAFYLFRLITKLFVEMIWHTYKTVKF